MKIPFWLTTLTLNAAIATICIRQKLKSTCTVAS